jgi:gas vesicle protein
MGQDPGTIRKEIEETRSQMGDTVEALGYKADVPTRAKESVQVKVDSVKSTLTGAAGRVSDATPDGDQVRGQARQAVSVAQGNPLGLAIGAVAVGFVAGMLIPETQKEHETLGEMSDQVTDQLRDTAQQALDHGKEAAQQVAQQTVETAKETAQQAAQEHGEQLKETARENAEQVTS